MKGKTWNINAQIEGVYVVNLIIKSDIEPTEEDVLKALNDDTGLVDILDESFEQAKEVIWIDAEEDVD